MKALERAAAHRARDRPEPADMHRQLCIDNIDKLEKKKEYTAENSSREANTMADITKSTVSSSSGGGSIVSKSDTASKASSDLVTGMADYQNCPMELIAAQGQVPGNQQHDAAVVEVVSDALGSWELLAESDKQGIMEAAAALSEGDQAASRNFKQGKQQGK